MTVRHHISDELLADYATGALAEGYSLAVATHLALCPQCRARLARFEAVGGEMLDALAPKAEPDLAPSSLDASWQALLGRLDKAPAQAGKPRAEAGETGTYVFPEPLRSYVGSDAAGVKWRPLGRGAYQMMIPTGETRTSVRLLRIPAGKPVPEHGHGGRELTLVLAGSFRDETGVFGRGDLEDANETLEHQPVASDEEDCICLAVTDAPLRFKSRLMRLVQPMLGI